MIMRFVWVSGAAEKFEPERRTEKGGSFGKPAPMTPALARRLSNCVANVVGQFPRLAKKPQVRALYRKIEKIYHTST